MRLVQAVFFIKKQLNFLIILVKPILVFARWICQLQLKNEQPSKTVQFSSGSSELIFIAPNKLVCDVIDESLSHAVMVQL